MSLPPVAVLEAIFTRDAGPGGKPVRIDEIAELGGGVSNASYRIASDRGEIVLRCSPTADRKGSAHDMAREHGVLAAVSAIYPACPRPLWTGRDERLNGDYLVMEYREGTAAMRGRLAALSPPDADAFCETFIRQLVDLHSLPSSRLQAALGSETRGFRERQIKGWARRHAQAELDSEDIRVWLQAGLSVLPPYRPSVLHYDYKFDNLLVDLNDAPKINAVIDWELCTLGDPLMDVGCMLAYWTEATDTPLRCALRRGDTDITGMWTRAELVDRYLFLTGGQPPAFPAFYEVFGLYRLAGIAAQVATSPKTDPHQRETYRSATTMLLDEARTLMSHPFRAAL